MFNFNVILCSLSREFVSQGLNINVARVFRDYNSFKLNYGVLKPLF